MLVLQEPACRRSDGERRLELLSDGRGGKQEVKAAPFCNKFTVRERFPEFYSLMPRFLKDEQRTNPFKDFLLLWLILKQKEMRKSSLICFGLT